MSKLHLKITGLTVLIVSVLTGVCVLWPAGSLDTKQIPQKEKSVLTAQPSTEKSHAKRQLQPEDIHDSPKAANEIITGVSGKNVLGYQVRSG